MTVDILSIEAYCSIKESKLVKRQRILETIRVARHPSSADIERLTGIPRTTVTGRLKELEDDGEIFKAGTKLDPFTGKTVHWYKVVE